MIHWSSRTLFIRKLLTTQRNVLGLSKLTLYETPRLPDGVVVVLFMYHSSLGSSLDYESSLVLNSKIH